MKNLPLHDALSLLDNCPMAMLLEENGRIRYFNQAFATLLGDAADTLVSGSAADDLVAPLLTENAVINWIMPDGEERWLAIDTVAIEDRPGTVVRFYPDVTDKLRLKKERDALTSQIDRQSLRDAWLTGLLSRYGILVSLDPMVSRCRRYNYPLTIVTMNLATNPGDARERALAQVARLLKDQTRWADLVGCTAGHDFILVLQETTQDAALQLVEKLAQQISSLHDTGGASLRSSFGITQCQKNDNAETMLERAAVALMEARNNDSGRSIAV